MKFFVVDVINFAGRHVVVREITTFFVTIGIAAMRVCVCTKKNLIPGLIVQSGGV
jgi:hypothetical protein